MQKRLARTPPSKIPPWIRLQLAIIVFVAAQLCHTQSPYAEEIVPKYQILHINSYHRDYQWSDDIERGVRNSLKNTPGVIIHHEYMDTKRIDDPKNIAAFKQYLVQKLKMVSFDIVVVNDNNAFEFMRSNYYELFDNVPVVFCGVNSLKRYDLEGYDNFTGIKEKIDFRANVKLIQQLHPDARKIHVIIDRTHTGRQELKQLRAEARSFETEIIIEFAPDMPMRQLMKYMTEIPPTDVAFFAFYLRDMAGRNFEFSESARLVSQSSQVPVYGGWDFNLGHGIIGGMLTSGYYQGYAAGTMIRKILDGTPVSDIPVEGISANRYMFDQQQLNRFFISANNLPRNSIIINKPQTVWTSYKTEIIAIVIIFLLMLISLVLLYRYNRRCLRVHNELLRSEEGLRQIIDTIPHMVYAKDDNGKFIIANRALASTLGASPDEVTGKKHDEIHPVQGEVEQMLSEDQQVLETGKAMFIPEQKYTDWLETTHWLQVTRVPFTAQNGKQAVLSVSTDITRRRQDEETLRKTRNALRSFIDSMTSILVGLDADCKVVHWNSKAAKHSGISLPRAQDRDVFSLLPRLKRFEAEIRTAVRGKESFESTKIPFTHSDSEEIFYEDIFVHPLLDGTGAVMRIDDVTERARIDAMMIQTEKMMSVGGLAAGMAHEINNPLGAILQGTQNITRRLSPDFKANEKIAAECGVSLEKMECYMGKRNVKAMLSGISESAIRAAEIVRNMLEFSRKSESQFAPQDINKLLDRTIDLASSDYDLKKSYDFRKIRIIRSFDQDIPPIPMTSTEVEQVVLNLLKNAAQAMHDWKEMPEDPCIALRTEVEGDYLRIEIQDNGPGLSAEVRKRVFEPFFTTKAPGIGTGLGLSVSYFIITQNHQGEFYVESQKNKGATFIIKLPIKRKETLPSQSG